MKNMSKKRGGSAATGTGSGATKAMQQNSDANFMSAVKGQVKIDTVPFHQGAYTGTLPPKSAVSGK